MKPDERMSKPPELCKIAAGWAARGDGWAVHGRTPEEALEKYREAHKRRREILLRPLPNQPE